MLVIKFWSTSLTATYPGLSKSALGQKSERLENLNLRDLSRKIERTHEENADAYQLSITLNDDTKHVGAAIRELKYADKGDSLKSFLQYNYPEHHEQFLGIDEDGFQIYSLSLDYIIRTWLLGSNPFMAGIGHIDQDIDTLTRPRQKFRK
ncbi:hypothetical protein K469DRAFT_752959 [Zopfia rhizophila CBS 207.26]|uniref:Uncharacterized protein n=1 Tax=Zopfia rhizophila CBS 207.26 TaxID=1314779 RepID=A0A6A6DQ26_9PEZI|nr:hypothetical protein K469DRAFT_752959 [Zopfia rhizophila CBS 207.26]